MANFSGSFISNTYHRVLQLDTTLQDGTGSLIQSLPVTASNAISASYAISSSHEIIKEVSASIADTASFVEYSNVANKPTLLSSSAQIADDISGSFTAASSSFSTRLTTAESELDNTLISSSAQIANDISGSLGGNADLIRSLTATSITGSFTAVSSSVASRLDNLANDIIALSIALG